MKTTTLFFAFLFLFFHSIAQSPKEKDENFFFRIEFDSLGDCYGKCLVQTEWDTLKEKYVFTHERSKFNRKYNYIYDTIQLNYYFLEKHNPNINYIINYADTTHQLLMIQEESKWLSGCTEKETLDCQELLTEQVLKSPSFHKWINNTNIISSVYWKKENIKETYQTITRKVQKTPSCCVFKTTSIPAKYEPIIKIIPKKDIKEHQLNNIKLLCKKSSIVRFIKRNDEEVKIPAKYKLKETVNIKREAEIVFRKIVCNTFTKLISKIQKQLFALGFYSGDFLGELTDKTKEAIVNYQIKNNLPIGQLDMDTVNHILKRETPFKK